MLTTVGGPHRSKLVLASEPVEMQQLLISLCRFMTCSRLTEVRSLIFCHVNSNFGSVNYLLKGGGGWELKTRNELSPKSCQIFETGKFVFRLKKKKFWAQVVMALRQLVHWQWQLIPWQLVPSLWVTSKGLTILFREMSHSYYTAFGLDGDFLTTLTWLISLPLVQGLCAGEHTFGYIPLRCVGGSDEQESVPPGE